MSKKYELVKVENGKYRIRALCDIGEFAIKGQLGGIVDGECNLSQKGNCWIGEWASVVGDARVEENAVITSCAHVCCHALVCGNAEIYGDALISGWASVSGCARVYGKAVVGEHAKVYGLSKIGGCACIQGYSKVSEEATVCNARIDGRALVCGDAYVFGSAEITGSAKVKSMEDYLVFKNWWSSGRYFTWTRSNNRWTVGCFRGTGKELIAKAEKDSALSGREYARVVRYVEEVRKAMKEKEEGK